jgi:hypothetical protein
MTTNETRTFGLLLRSGLDSISPRTHKVTVELVSKKSDSQHPLGVSDDAFTWERPKHLAEVALDGLGIYGFISDLRTDEGKCRHIGDSVEFRNVFAIDATRARRMMKTLQRINKRIDGDKAYESGDKMMALANALKLDFVVEDRERFKHDPDRRWRWMSVAEGRNRYRELIEEAETAETERQGGLKPAKVTA